MREIKFRAWDKTTHKNGIMISWDTLKKFKLEDIFVILSEVELMQFTGQLDKNGTDIYVGDIVKYQGGDIESGTAEVKNFGNANNLIFEWIKQDTPNPSIFTSMIYFGCSEELEVIGNIHEAAQ